MNATNIFLVNLTFPNILTSMNGMILCAVVIFVITLQVIAICFLCRTNAANKGSRRQTDGHKINMRNLLKRERCQDDSDNRFQPVKVHNSLCRMLETESTHLDDDITKRLIMKHMCERKKQNTVATDIIGRSANATHPKETCLSSKGAPQMTVSTFDTDQNDMFNNLDIHSARTRSNSWSSVSPASTPPPSGSRTPSLESLIIASWSSDLEHLPRPTRDQLRNARRNLRHTTSDTSSTDYGSFCSAMNVTCMDKYIMEHVDYKVIAERRKEKRDTYRTIMMKLASAIPSPSASPPRVYDASSSQEWD